MDMKQKIVVGLVFCLLFASLFISNVSATSLSALHVSSGSIKDSSNNTIVLKGVNVPWLTGDPDGSFMGSSTWSESNVHAEFAKIKSWGANIVRLTFAVDFWINDANEGGGPHMQYVVDRLLTIAEEEGLYVLLAPTYLKGDSSYSPKVSGYQNPLPYPPYQGDDLLGTDFSTIIASKLEFVNFMVDISSTLKSHNNVLFALWNEPQDQGGSTLNEYYDVCQDSITAMRSASVTNLILVMGENWGSPYVDLQYPSHSHGLRWFSLVNFVDSTGNLVIEAHDYRGHIHYGATNSYLLADLNSGLSFMDFYNQTYPIIVSEIGGFDANMANTATQESQYFDNMFTLFDNNDIGYIAWAFWDVTSYKLHTGYPDANPTVAGTILRNHLLYSPPPTPTPSPTPTPLYSVTFSSKDMANNIISSGISRQLYSGSTPISYTMGSQTLIAGSYSLKTYYLNYLVNTTSFSLPAYNGVTVPVYLNLKQGTYFNIIANNTLSSLTITSENSTSISFSATGSNGPYSLVIPTNNNALFLNLNGVAQAYGSGWTYDSVNKCIVVSVASLPAS